MLLFLLPKPTHFSFLSVCERANALVGQAMAAPHMSRESTVKLLEALKVAKMKRVADLRSAEIATALTEVVAKVRGKEIHPV